MMDDLRLLIREMVKQLIQDDALFRRSEPPGILTHFDEPGDYDEMPLSCPLCGTEHEGPCNNPRRKRDRPTSQIYGIVFDDE
jgi:hypothetical protein